MTLYPPNGDLVQRSQQSVRTPLPADGAALAWAVAAGIGADFAGRAGLASLATAMMFATASIGLILSRRVRRAEALVVIFAASIISSWLAVRSSSWLIVPDTTAAICLLVLGASLQDGSDLFDLDVPGWLGRAGISLAHTYGGAAFVLGGAKASVAVRRVRGLHVAWLRQLLGGLAIAVPVLLVFGALLRSADPVFGSFIDVRVNAASLLAHPLLVALGASAMGGLLRLASLTCAPQRPPRPRATLGMTEALVVIGAVDSLFGLFALAQVVAATGGASHVLHTAGLTYAQYARSGYFQLLWVAGLTLALLVVLHTMVERPPGRSSGAFRVAGAVAALLTILIALVAFRRLAVYEKAFGLTMLRLCCQVFAVWLIAVFALLAISLFGLWQHRQWFAGSAMAAGLVILLAFNAANPEALVARHDVGRGAQADINYLATLSDDAVPTVIAHLGDLSRESAAAYSASRCDRQQRQHHHGWASYNLGGSRASRALASVCRHS